MRLPYAPKTFQPPPSSSQNIAAKATAAVYAQTAARRAPQTLQPLDLTLLHSPPIASGWNSFFGAIRTGGILPASVKELIICRVAVLNGAVYEWQQHLPLLMEHSQMGKRGVQEIRDGKRSQKGAISKTSADSGLYYTDDEGNLCYLPQDEEKDEPAQTTESVADLPGEGLSERQWAVMAYTDAMTLDVRVPDPIFERLKALFSNQEVVETTATVAAYNCASRFLVALDVGEMVSGSQ
ncbi:MAG: hypothetical protein LQ342_008085 [Letrouitia transgressa]|nr:MAG: hypothetical protein LQ342_008085 [Letrouitia transgressa]